MHTDESVNILELRVVAVDRVELFDVAVANELVHGATIDYL